MRFVVTVQDSDPVAVALQTRDLLRCVSRTNLWLMHKHGNSIPPLYESGIKFRTEPWGDQVQHAANCVEALERGWADCKVLCCWLRAERILQFPKLDPEKFDFKIYWRVFDSDPLHNQIQGRSLGECRIYHVQLRLPKEAARALGLDSDLEDPSRMLHQ